MNTNTATANLLPDTVEIITASGEGWHVQDVARNGRVYLADEVGNRVQLILTYGGSVEVVVLWAASGTREELTLDARGGATRIARTVLVLCDAPDDDATI